MIQMIMEHPIPQNVTSFEFKLVGDMTLKQFLYLCIGVTIAYLTFIYLLEPTPFIAWPIIIISASLGAAFAFMPIADRPLDYWLMTFIRAIYSPTQRVWTKSGQNYTQYPLFKNRVNIFSPVATAPQPQNNPLNPLSPPVQPPPTAMPLPQIPPNLPSEEELAKTVELAKEAQALQVKIIDTQRQLSDIKNTTTVSTNPQQYSEQVNQVLENFQKLVEDAAEIKAELAKTTHQPAPTQENAKISIVNLPKPTPSPIILTTYPNVINGIITDSENNYVDGAVVVIYDKEGLPVRALKTNKLGQFSGSTPLPNGTYTIQLEKDNLVFDVIQIQLEGTVLPPLTIAAKRVGNA